MLWHLLVWQKDWISPAWLGREACRSGRSLEANPYEKLDDRARFNHAYEAERQLTSNASDGAVDNWRLWGCLVVLAAFTLFCFFFSGVEKWLGAR